MVYGLELRNTSIKRDHKIRNWSCYTKQPQSKSLLYECQCNKATSQIWEVKCQQRIKLYSIILFSKGWWHIMAFILHATLYSLINYIFFALNFFLMLVPLGEHLFWPPSTVYISHQQLQFSHFILGLWGQLPCTASTPCPMTCCEPSFLLYSCNWILISLPP